MGTGGEKKVHNYTSIHCTPLLTPHLSKPPLFSLWFPLCLSNHSQWGNRQHKGRSRRARDAFSILCSSLISIPRCSLMSLPWRGLATVPWRCPPPASPLPFSFFNMFVPEHCMLLRFVPPFWGGGGGGGSTAVYLSLWAGTRCAHSGQLKAFPSPGHNWHSQPYQPSDLCPLHVGFFFYCWALHEKQSSGKGKKKAVNGVKAQKPTRKGRSGKWEKW